VENEESIFNKLKEKTPGVSTKEVETEKENPNKGRQVGEKTESSETSNEPKPEDGENETNIDSGLPDIGIEMTQEPEESEESDYNLPNPGD